MKKIIISLILSITWFIAVTADYSTLTKNTWDTLTATNWNQLVNNVKLVFSDNNGNVGINTTNPRRVATSSKALTIDWIWNTTWPDIEFIWNDVVAWANPHWRIMFINNISWTPTMTSMIGGYWNSTGQGAWDIRIYTKNSTWSINQTMHIWGNGKVWIGSTAPTAKLNIIDTTASWNNIADSLSKSVFTIQPEAPSSNTMRFWWTGAWGIWIQVSNSNGAWLYPIILNPYGWNVGIWNTSPNSKLEVTIDTVYNTGPWNLYLSNTADTTALRIWVDNTNNFTYIWAIEQWVNWNRNLAIQPLWGNIWMWLIDPDEKLEVRWALKLSHTDDLHYWRILSDSAHWLYINSVWNGWWTSAWYDKITYRWNEHHFLKSSWSRVLGILDNGNVWIWLWSSDPTQKLEVNGGVKIWTVATCDSAAEWTVRYNGWIFQWCTASGWVNLH